MLFEYSGEITKAVASAYQERINEIIDECNARMKLFEKAEGIISTLEQLTGDKFETCDSCIDDDFAVIEGSVDVDEYGDYLFIKIKHDRGDDSVFVNIELWEMFEEDDYRDADETEWMCIEVSDKGTACESLIEFESDDVSKRIKNVTELREYLKSFHEGH